MVTPLGRPAHKTVRRPTSAVFDSDSLKGVDAIVILREMLARGLQMRWIAREEGLVIMRWLDHLDGTKGGRRDWDDPDSVTPIHKLDVGSALSG